MQQYTTIPELQRQALTASNDSLVSATESIFGQESNSLSNDVSSNRLFESRLLFVFDPCPLPPPRTHRSGQCCRRETGSWTDRRFENVSRSVSNIFTSISPPKKAVCDCCCRARSITKRRFARCTKAVATPPPTTTAMSARARRARSKRRLNKPMNHSRLCCEELKCCLCFKQTTN